MMKLITNGLLMSSPRVRTQEGATCVFNAMASIVEFQKKGVVIDVDSFFTDYIKTVMVPFGEDQNRVITALKLLHDQGVIANCDGRETSVHISGYEFHQGMDDYQVFAMIQSGTPLLGTFRVRHDFSALGSDIYEINPDEPVPATHIVMFVGYGERKGRRYLVFQNSYGKDWGTGGLGRVYFDQVYQLEHDKGFQLITVTVDREVGTSLAVAEPPALDDEPLPRLEILDQVKTCGYAYLAGHGSGPDEGDMFHKMFKFTQAKKDAAITTDELTKLFKSYQEKAFAHQDASGTAWGADPEKQTR